MLSADTSGIKLFAIANKRTIVDADANNFIDVNPPNLKSIKSSIRQACDCLRPPLVIRLHPPFLCLPKGDLLEQLRYVVPVDGTLLLECLVVLRLETHRLSTGKAGFQLEAIDEVGADTLKFRWEKASVATLRSLPELNTARSSTWR